jgi:hypothetical protein
VFNFPLSNKYVFLISFHTFRKLFFSAFFSKNLNLDLSVFTDCKINIYIFTKTILDNLYNLDHPNLFIWMMSNDEPVFLSAFIEYLDNNFLSRKEKKII